MTGIHYYHILLMCFSLRIEFLLLKNGEEFEWDWDVSKKSIGRYVRCFSLVHQFSDTYWLVCWGLLKVVKY